MSASIVELLESCGVPLPHDDSAWTRLVVLHNLGGLPSDEVEGDLIANRGFNLLVVSEAGAPTHFCKFRPSQPSATGFGPLFARLSRTNALSTVIPETWSVRSGGIDAEVSRYMPGELLERRLPSMNAREIRAQLSQIIRVATRLSVAVAETAPTLLGENPNVNVRDAAGWALDAVRDAGLAPSDVARLADALSRAGTLPRALQHGDLWPRNALFYEGHWWILDLDFYGRVQVPMYDAFHLVRTSWDVQPESRRRAPTWIDALRAGDADSAMYRDVLRGASLATGLSARQAGGGMVYYVVDIAARLYLRRLPGRYVEPYLREALRMAEWIDSGKNAEDLFLGAR